MSQPKNPNSSQGAVHPYPRASTAVNQRVVQTKLTTKPFSASPVYRPQEARAAQSGNARAGVQSRDGRPLSIQPKANAGLLLPPPVYRPQKSAPILQPRMANTSTPGRSAPPVYRPQPQPLRAAPSPANIQKPGTTLQPKPRGGVPPAYRSEIRNSMVAPVRPRLNHESMPIAQVKPIVAANIPARPGNTINLKAVQNGVPSAKLAIRGSGPGFSVVQRLGTNITLADEVDRYFETPNEKSRIRVDPENDAYLEGHFKELTRVSQVSTSLANKIVYIIRMYKEIVPYDKQAKIDALENQKQEITTLAGKKIMQGVRNVGTMFHAGAVTCWEKAAMCHLSLAEIGIGSKLEGGYSKTTGTGHAWLVLDVGCVVDPTSGKILARNDYESAYDITVPAKRVAIPKVAVDVSTQKEALKGAKNLIGTISTPAVKEIFKPIKLAVDTLKKEEEARAEFEREQRKRVGPLVLTPEGNIARQGAVPPSQIRKIRGRHMDDWSLYEEGGEFEL